MLGLDRFNFPMVLIAVQSPCKCKTRQAARASRFGSHAIHFVWIHGAGIISAMDNFAAKTTFAVSSTVYPV
jgi:hypothetical protein